jgi:hypothetical protein
METPLYCSNCRSPVLRSIQRCKCCGASFEPQSSSKPVTEAELASGATMRLVISVLVLLGVGVIGFLLTIFFQVLKGLAGGH